MNHFEYRNGEMFAENVPLKRIAGEVGEFGYRVFADSAPVMEIELAARAGLGWRGKHTLLLSRDAGSFFFLGEIYTDLRRDPVREPLHARAEQLVVVPSERVA